MLTRWCVYEQNNFELTLILLLRVEPSQCVYGQNTRLYNIRLFKTYVSTWINYNCSSFLNLGFLASKIISLHYCTVQNFMEIDQYFCFLGHTPSYVSKKKKPYGRVNSTWYKLITNRNLPSLSPCNLHPINSHYQDCLPRSAEYFYLFQHIKVSPEELLAIY